MMTIPQQLLEDIKNNRAYEVVLERKSLDDQDIQDLAAALANNTSITTLNLRNNDPLTSEEQEQFLDKDDKLVPLFQAIKNHPQLTYVYLQNIALGDQGAQLIANLLTANNIINQVILHNNVIGPAGAKALAPVLNNSNLGQIHLNNNKIGGEGLKAIAEGLEQNHCIKQLHLNDNNINDLSVKKLLAAIKQNDKIEVINLNSSGLNDKHNNIKDKGAEYLIYLLKVNPIVKALDISGNNVSQDNLNSVRNILDMSEEQRQNLKQQTIASGKDPLAGNDNEDEGESDADQTSNDNSDEGDNNGNNSDLTIDGVHQEDHPSSEFSASSANDQHNSTEMGGQVPPETNLQ